MYLKQRENTDGGGFICYHNQRIGPRYPVVSVEEVFVFEDTLQSAEPPVEWKRSRAPHVRAAAGEEKSRLSKDMTCVFLYGDILAVTGTVF